MTTKGCSLLADIATVYDVTLDADANSVYLTVKNLRANPALKALNEASAGSMATLNSGADVIAEKGSAGLPVCRLASVLASSAACPVLPAPMRQEAMWVSEASMPYLAWGQNSMPVWRTLRQELSSNS